MRGPGDQLCGIGQQWSAHQDPREVDTYKRFQKKLSNSFQLWVPHAGRRKACCRNYHLFGHMLTTVQVKCGWLLGTKVNWRTQFREPTNSIYSSIESRADPRGNLVEGVEVSMTKARILYNEATVP